MTRDRTWHADPEALQDYAAGRADTATAWSVETHLTGCADCRRLLTAALPAADVALLEGVRRSLTLPPHATRPAGWRTTVLVAVIGPPWAWAALVGTVLALLLAARLAPVAVAPAAVGVTWPSALAPLVPVAMVAAVYAVVDRDVAVGVTPRGGLELVLLRTAAVLAGSLVVVLGGLWVLGAVAVAWLLPGLGLTVGALVLGTWTGIERAALTLAGAWAVVVAAVMTPRSPALDRLSGLVAPSGEATVLWALALTVLVAALVARRRVFDVPLGPAVHHGGPA